MVHNSEDRCCGTVARMAAFAITIALSIAARTAMAASVTIPQLQTSAEKGHVPQELELAADYFLGRGVPKDLHKAAYWYQKAAESGDPEAENEIGFFFEKGIGVPADPARAFHWFQLSAASGLAKAKVNLAVAYVWGIGVRKDEQFASQLFREAVNRGSGLAAAYLGDMYFFGSGVNKDTNAAEHWFGVGVKMHDPVAAYNLGSLFSVNDAHPHDFSKAAKLLRQSASAGYVPAMHSLGLLLIRYPEFARSPQEARALLETAADSGSWRTSLLLGIIARDGMGVPKDPAAAYYHFQIAVLQGGDTARSLLANDISRLSDQLSPARAQELISNASSWFQQHHSAVAFVYKGGENWKLFPVWTNLANDESVVDGQLVPSPPA